MNPQERASWREAISRLNTDDATKERLGNLSKEEAEAFVKGLIRGAGFLRTLLDGIKEASASEATEQQPLEPAQALLSMAVRGNNRATLVPLLS